MSRVKGWWKCACPTQWQPCHCWAESPGTLCSSHHPQCLRACLLQAAAVHSVSRTMRPQHCQRGMPPPLPPLSPEQAHVSQTMVHNGRSIATSGVVTRLLEPPTSYVFLLLNATPIQRKRCSPARRNVSVDSPVNLGCLGMQGTGAQVHPWVLSS